MIEQPTAEELYARLSMTIDQLVAGEITPAEANAISRDAGRTIAKVEAALQVAKVVRQLETSRVDPR